MPTYAYRCKDCQHEYEAFQSIKEEAHKTCPQCKGEVVRLIGAGAGIVFRGSGFYVTDYRKDGSQAKGTEGKKNEKGTEGKTSPSDAKGASSTKDTPAPTVSSKTESSS